MRRFISKQIDLQLYDPVYLRAHGSSLYHAPDPDAHMFKIRETGPSWQVLRRRQEAP